MWRKSQALFGVFLPQMRPSTVPRIFVCLEVSDIELNCSRPVFGHKKLY